MQRGAVRLLMIRKQIEAISFNLIQLYARIESQWIPATSRSFEQQQQQRYGSDQFPQDYGKFARPMAEN